MEICKSLILQRLPLLTRMPYYAVQRGRNVGVYHSWSECENEVKGYSNARYKKFNSSDEAWSFANGGDKPSAGGYGGSRGSSSNYGGGYSGGYSGGYGGGYSGGYGGGYSQGRRNYSTYANDSSDASSDDDYYVPTKQTKTEPVKVYTDGCCHANGRSQSRAGIGVYWGPNHPMNVSEPLDGRPTNNRAEIHAARRAIEQAKSAGHKSVNVHTDSKFLTDSVTKWMPKWQSNGWKLSDGKPVVNREDFEALNKARHGMNVTWTHVPGHQGVEGNEQADRLANEGARKGRRY